MDDRYPIYLDYNATTPLDPQVSSSMAKLLQKEDPLCPKTCFGNPSSSHIYGRTARKALDESRRQIAVCIGASDSSEILLTSGGTESINHAIQGSCLRSLHQKSSQDKENWPNHIVTSAVEHVAVSETIAYLERHYGFTKTVLPVDAFGQVSPVDLENALTIRTVLVTVMLANNEVGTIQPIADIVSKVRKWEQNHSQRILVHTDASQAVGKIPVNVGELGVDLLTLAGHKIYGPKGIGVLYIRSSVGEDSLVEKFCQGAKHEMNRRAGTENVLLAVGLGKACELVAANIEKEGKHLAELRDRLQTNILRHCDECGIEVRVNGNPEIRLPNTLSLSFRNILSPILLEELSASVSCSAGAACHSDGDVAVSHVLAAMNVPLDYAKGTLRLSVGRFTSDDDIRQAASNLCNAVQSVATRLEESTNHPKETVLEYFWDTYKFESHATVISVNRVQDGSVKLPSYSSSTQVFSIDLDRTIFYPQGGGQPSDTGEICSLDGDLSFQVDFVLRTSDGIVHHYGYLIKGEESQLKALCGVTVKLAIDKEKRLLHARLHSAGHLIDQAMQLCGVNLKAIKGCHFPNLGPSVEYEGSIEPELASSLKERLQTVLDNLIKSEIPTTIHHVAPKDAHGFCIDNLSPDDLSGNEELRVVIVGGEKGCPCGGTHVRNTIEILSVNIKKISKKKGNLRVTYDVGPSSF